MKRQRELTLSFGLGLDLGLSLGSEQDMALARFGLRFQTGLGNRMSARKSAVASAWE